MIQVKENLYEVELVEGAVGNSIFIPSMSSLEPSKQAVFVAGGGIPRGVLTLGFQEVGYAS